MDNQFRTNEFLEKLMKNVSNHKTLTRYNLEELKADQTRKIQELKQLLKLERLD